jgi:hypothetical protein
MTFDRGRFVRVCGLLDSAHDGEVVNAARAALRMLKDAGLSWAEVVIERPPPTAWDRFAVKNDGLAKWIMANVEKRVEAYAAFNALQAGHDLTAAQIRTLTLLALAARHRTQNGASVNGGR